MTRTKIAESTLRRFGLIGGIALLFALAGFVALGVVLGGKVPPLFATARKAVEQNFNQPRSRRYSPRPEGPLNRLSLTLNQHNSRT